MTTTVEKSPKAAAPSGTARERLLSAASELFYAEGIHTVGIDRVIERAGVAKASLYKTFGSKDELIRAYLQDRHSRTEARVMAALASAESPRDKLLAIFAAQQAYYESAQFRGCAFMNASAESQPGSSVEQASDEYRAWLRGVFHDIAAEGGATAPDEAAGQLLLIYDGCAASARMDRTAEAFRSARAVAGMAFDAAVGQRTAGDTPVA